MGRGISGKIGVAEGNRISGFVSGYGLGVNYSYDEALVSLRIGFKEQVMKTPDGIFNLGSSYPVIYLNLHRGFLNGDVKSTYNKAEMMINKTFDFNLAGRFTVHLTGGWADGDLPLGMLYDMRGSNYKDKLFVSNTFQTMDLTSFYAGRFVGGHFYYDFKTLLIKTKHFAPNLVLTYSAVWGDLPDKETLSLDGLSVPDKVYSETGILINNILVSQYTGIGAGVFYKLGYYSSQLWKNNFVFKLSLTFLLD
jgi:hypothetical protein